MVFIVKYPMDCGIFGVIRRGEGSDRVNGDLVARAIESIKFRGGAGLGSGFALFNKESMALGWAFSLGRGG